MTEEIFEGHLPTNDELVLHNGEASRKFLQAPTLYWRQREEVSTREPFSNLFPIKPEDLQAISTDMAINGYDKAQPLDVWQNGDEEVLLDGHTRLQAAELADIKNVPVYVHHFVSERSAYLYAIAKQRLRRNLTPKEMAQLLARTLPILDQRKERGGDRSVAIPSSEGIDQDKHTGDSATQTAEVLGTSRATVERARAIMDSDDEELKEKLASGDATTTEVYRDLQEKKGKKEKKPTIPTTIKKIEISLSDLGVESTRKLFDLLQTYIPTGSTAKLDWCDFMDVTSDIEQILGEG